ncbi:MAG: DUF4339 domain-containing protein [Ruminococcaceae bacterium]|nr:DUF4339 domain-containing protein [Oscillospiraceae bacterium]
MWNCKCGNTCSDESHFCDKCGAKKTEFENIQDCQWFYYDDKKRVGPLSFEEMKEAITSGKIFADSLVWHQGLDEWKKASETSLQTFLVMTVPPVSKKLLNDKWIWCLATIPLVIMYILYFLFNIRDSSINLIDILVLVLNCLFLTLDTKYLENSGYHMRKWLFLGLIFIPLYLFIRPIKTNKNFAPAIVWCILFFIGISIL